MHNLTLKSASFEVERIYYDEDSPPIPPFDENVYWLCSNLVKVTMHVEDTLTIGVDNMDMIRKFSNVKHLEEYRKQFGVFLVEIALSEEAPYYMLYERRVQGNKSAWKFHKELPAYDVPFSYFALNNRQLG